MKLPLIISLLEATKPTATDTKKLALDKDMLDGNKTSYPLATTNKRELAPSGGQSRRTFLKRAASSAASNAVDASPAIGALRAFMSFGGKPKNISFTYTRDGKPYKLGDPVPDENYEFEVSPDLGIGVIGELDDGEGKDSKAEVQSWHDQAKKMLLADKFDKKALDKLWKETESSYTFGVETYNGWYIEPEDDITEKSTVQYIYAKTEIMLHLKDYWNTPARRPLPK